MNIREVTAMLTDFVEDINQRGSVCASFSRELDCVFFTVLPPTLQGSLLHVRVSEWVRKGDLLALKAIADHLIADYEERTKGVNHE